MKYSILAIDDEESVHLLIQNILGEGFTLHHARDAQEAIDLLSVQAVNLILADIHMPGMSGLDFLESLTEDAEKKDIPVLVMTHLPTAEKEQKALDLGAADFIDKNLLTEDTEKIRERIRMKLVTHVRNPEMSIELKRARKRLISGMMSEAITGDFISTAQKLCSGLNYIFQIDHASFWTVADSTPSLIASAGIQLPADYGSEQLKQEENYQRLLAEKEPYLTNHVFTEEEGIAIHYSREKELPAEMGIPLFSVSDIELLKNDMKIPENAEPFACIMLKRNKLYSTMEYKIISVLLTRTGSILWRLYGGN